MPPHRFNPAATPPQELSNLVHKVALQSTAKLNLAIDSSALSALETALDSVFVRLMSDAYSHAKEDNRDTIEVSDLEYVRRQLKATRKKKA